MGGNEKNKVLYGMGQSMGRLKAIDKIDHIVNLLYMHILKLNLLKLPFFKNIK